MYDYLQNVNTIAPCVHHNTSGFLFQSFLHEVSAIHSANVRRMIDLVDAEITGTHRFLEAKISDYDY